MDSIIVRGLNFKACHGVLDSEKTCPQLFQVDLELFLDLQAAGQQDELNLTVDYDQVYQLVQNIVEGPSCNLIETLAEKIAQDGEGIPTDDQVFGEIMPVDRTVMGIIGESAAGDFAAIDEERILGIDGELQDRLSRFATKGKRAVKIHILIGTLQWVCQPDPTRGGMEVHGAPYRPPGGRVTRTA